MLCLVCVRFFFADFSVCAFFSLSTLLFVLLVRLLLFARTALRLVHRVNIKIIMVYIPDESAEEEMMMTRRSRLLRLHERIHSAFNVRFLVGFFLFFVGFCPISTSYLVS